MVTLRGVDEQTPSVLTQLPSWLLTQSATHVQRIVGEAFAAGGARGYHFRLLATLVDLDRLVKQRGFEEATP